MIPASVMPKEMTSGLRLLAIINITTAKILNDNTQAFYSLAGQNIATLNKMKDLQPTL